MLGSAKQLSGFIAVVSAAVCFAGVSAAFASHSVPSGTASGSGQAPPATQVPPPASENPPPVGENPPPTETPQPISPPPPATAPKKAAAPFQRTVYLEKDSIAVLITCRLSGTIRLSQRPGGRVGAAPFECSETTYSAVATVDLKPGVAAALRRKLSRRTAIPLRAIFVVDQRLRSKLSLERSPAPESTGEARAPVPNLRADLYWTRGYLSCGRPDQLQEYSFRMYHPTVSASGNRADGGFYNDTPNDNWVWYRPYLYFHGHGWWAGDWRGPVYLPPWSTVALSQGDVLGDPAQGEDSYIAGASYIWFYNGMKDWNWLPADSPYFGYPVHGTDWCYVA